MQLSVKRGGYMLPRSQCITITIQNYFSYLDQYPYQLDYLPELMLTEYCCCFQKKELHELVIAVQLRPCCNDKDCAPPSGAISRKENYDSRFLYTFCVVAITTAHLFWSWQSEFGRLAVNIKLVFHIFNASIHELWTNDCAAKCRTASGFKLLIYL